MKRLITILISFVGCISLFGQQKAPVVVAGNVYMAGPLYSQGAVHVYAADSTQSFTNATGNGKININTNGVFLADTIILYTNDRYDGLFANIAGEVKGGVSSKNTPECVIVRKSFRKNANGSNIWTRFSIPFDVHPNNIKDTNTQIMLKDGSQSDGQYFVYQFDGRKRAEANDISDVGNSWTDIDYTGGLKKGTGYQVFVDETAPSGNIDFSTSDQNAISALFDKADQNFSFEVFKRSTPYAYIGTGSVVGESDGWAFIGGLNTSSFTYRDYTDNPPISFSYTGNNDKVNTYSLYIPNQNSASTTISGGYASVSASQPRVVGPYTPFYYVPKQRLEGFTPPVADNTSIFINATVMNKGMNDNLTNSQLRYFTQQNSLFSIMIEEPDADVNEFGFRPNNIITFNIGAGYLNGGYCNGDQTNLLFYDDKDPVVYITFPNETLEMAKNVNEKGISLTDNIEFNLMYSVPKAGKYSFHMFRTINADDLKNVILEDTEENKYYDLLQSGVAYQFTTNGSVTMSDRFKLHINSTSLTEIPTTATAAAVYAYVNDNVLTVKNLTEGDAVQVFDLTGRLVAQGKAFGREFSTTLSQKGIYIVNVGAKSSVLKVINK